MTIKQRTIEVSLIEGPQAGFAEGHIVTVKRMPWGEFRRFVHSLFTHYNAAIVLFRGNDLAVVLEELPKLILSVEGLVFTAINTTTGLDRDTIDKLDPQDVFDLVHAACLVHQGEELKKSLAGVQGSVVGLLNFGQTTPSAPTTTGEKSTPLS
jgi:hypothetical protein